MAIEIADRMEVRRSMLHWIQTNEYVREVQSYLYRFVIAERKKKFVAPEFVGVLVFRISNVPLKRLTTEAIEIADSHGGNNSIWYRIGDWSLAEHMY